MHGSIAWKRPRIIVLALALAVAAVAGAPFADEDDRIRPWPGNPFYWQYKGEPVLLLGGSQEDNLFNHPDGLEEHLDLLQAAGGNYLRNTMSDRNVENRYAFAQREDGLFDLDRWDVEYWQRFERFLRLCHERDIIVQIEIWDPWDLFASEAPLGYGPTNRGWESHPFNPKNNVNYTAEKSGLAEEITYFSGRNPSDHTFFSTVPTLDDNKVVRGYQEAFVNRILDVSLAFPNVLYCMNNEIGEDPDWGRYWARFIRSRAEAEGVDVYLADMRRNTNFASAEQVALLHDHEHYDYFEISQNNANVGQAHYNNLLSIRERLSDHAKPLNNVKIYGGRADWTTSVDEGVRRFWRNIFAGSASARFHRPGPAPDQFGPGLSHLAQANIRGMRIVMDEMGWPAIVPDQGLAELAVPVDLAVSQSGAFTLEAWITPARETQGGPARIVTLSQDHGTRNFTFGQEQDAFEVRLRTTTTSANGLPAVRVGAGADASFAAIRSPAGDRAAIFVTHGSLLRVNLDRLGDDLTGQWFQPETADRLPAPVQPGGLFLPPSQADWVLILR